MFMKKYSLVLSIRSLDIGGAERQFVELVKHIDKSRFDVTVCTMYGGVQEELVRNISGVEYINLQKQGRYDFVNFYKKYRALLQMKRPDLIYSFLGEMNLFSLWCKPRRTKLIWGFRASNMDLSQYGKVSQLLFWLQKKLSCRVDKIIANSHVSIEFHRQSGFCMERAAVIYNGIDTQRFRRNVLKRAAFRQKYELGENDIALGIVARIDYMKGYTVLAEAAKRLLQRYANIKFFAIGDGDEGIKKECEAILGSLNDTRFIWLGRQQAVEDFYSGFDIVVSSSVFGEGFSNSIAEAMSSQVPCVVTDVGESSTIVADTGEVVEPGSVESLCAGVVKMLERDDLHALGKRARTRVKENFSIEKMVKKSERIMHGLVE